MASKGKNVVEVVMHSAKRIARPRKRRRGKETELVDVPSLKDFVHKQTVIHLYRTFFRAAARIPDDKFREDAQKEIRQTFKNDAIQTDKLAITMALKDGERRLQQFCSMVGYDVSGTSEDPDSWLNIKDENDPRGRVGVEWPWEKKGGSD
eukprot:CAMPEP_0118674804 /NCGR_PEP_ID=MMETSP0800-20121206/1089_1 /TAXON_ID=210618 ORGANISM="Striatella unipunctata, Strain CCMP2910" /NCGR_SAMPLE_ID=MMETSP0800 /ASSEMBLY_ACC=CAM_ASM_000638 /LENGTH=149 /DNA_ID=CAMNT_0006570035 /DNA_START=81 /DNA_END=530 /DNA_ORIENTATION=-